MVNFKTLFILIFCFSSSCILTLSAQNEDTPTAEPTQEKEVSKLTGSLEANTNFFMRDSAYGAYGTPQYEKQLFGVDSWLNLNYSNWGFDARLRFDFFTNSYLLNPTGSYSAAGLGMWNIRKKLDRFTLQGGYIYDQIGSGVIFRAFEERPLAIDNALYGLHLNYDLNDDWKVKGFAGKQKQQLGFYTTSIRGGAIDGFVAGKDNKWSITPGFGVVNKQYDEETMNQIVSAISSYTKVDSIGASYNTYAFSLYNTLNVGNFTWYIEGAYKTNEVFNDPFANKITWTGDTLKGKLVNREGTLLYTSVTYSTEKFGITLEGKRTESFNFRVNPFTKLFQGAINFLPPMARQNSYRLTARYQAATQDLGELAVQGDIRYTVNDKIGLNVNISHITTLENKQLYDEIYSEVTYKPGGKTSYIGGIQFQNYNQEIYETKPGVDIVTTIVPYVEVLHKFTKKKALRVEASYMNTHQDYGSWIYLLAEYSIAPRWIFTVSDMYNVQPKKSTDLHYPTVGVTFNKDASRFSLNYVKQVQGIVCSGGICRFEPAFSGVRMNINTTF